MAVSTLVSQKAFRADSGPNMSLECDRLGTFGGWPCAFLQPRALAKAGFYYTRKEDVVKCAYCSIEIGKWEPGDDALADHRRWSPSCPFLRSMAPPAAAQGEDTCGKHGIEVRPNSFPEGMARLAVPSRRPTYPEYVVYESRLLSFKDWPKAVRQKPSELAEAGFFYTGRSDHTRCFHCGGGLKGWEVSGGPPRPARGSHFACVKDDDVPWEQHARWFPKCNYLILKKTREYVERVVSRQPAEKQEERQQKTVKPTDTKEEANVSFVCKICFCNKDAVLFAPCRHVVACVDCAPGLSTCPICRTPLESVVRVFLS